MDIVERGAKVTFPADHRAPTIHTLFCGFGSASRYAARLLRAGQPASSIRIFDAHSDSGEAAARLGLQVQARRSDDLAGLERHLEASITRIIVEVAEATPVEQLVRRARRNCPDAQILVVLAEPDRAEAILASGASTIVDVAAVAGVLLAAAAADPAAPVDGRKH